MMNLKQQSSIRHGFKLFFALLLALSATTILAAEDSTTLSVPQQEEGDEGEGEEQPVVSELVDVVVTQVTIPVGAVIHEDLIRIEKRPSNNIAVRAGVTIGAIEQVAGSIARTTIPQGKEVLVDMLALSASDIDQIGSDLSLHIQDGRVAIAMPINRFIGAAYAMRPGDKVDVLMSFNMIEYDLEFQNPLPNQVSLVDETALLLNEPFLLPAIAQGRLELVPEIDLVAEVSPRPPVNFSEGAEGEFTNIEQLPRRVTQLTMQQLEVLWVGSWRSSLEEGWIGPNNPFLEGADPDAFLPDSVREQLMENYGINVETYGTLQAIVENRRALISPDLVILSMPLQDALTMKWAYDEPGTDLDLVLRAQGDNAIFNTTSVSLPQLVEQAGLAIPEPNQYGLEPYIGTISIPRLEPFNNFSIRILSGQVHIVRIVVP